MGLFSEESEGGFELQITSHSNSIRIAYKCTTISDLTIQIKIRFSRFDAVRMPKICYFYVTILLPDMIWGTEVTNNSTCRIWIKQ